MTSTSADTAQLIASYGVHGLTAIFLVSIWSRSYKQLTSAPPDERRYFRKIHAAVVAMTFLLVAISAGVGIYTEFGREEFIRGTVTGLQDQPVPPQDPASPALVQDTIFPESRDVEMFVQQFPARGSSQTKDLGWVLIPRKRMQSISFNFHRSYDIALPPRPANDPVPASQPIHEKRYVDWRFSLDVGLLREAAGLSYEPASENDVRQPGQIYVLSKSGKKPVAWQVGGSKPMADSKPKEAGVGMGWPFQLPVVLAFGGDSLFQEDGSYDAQTGRILRQRLGSPDVNTQVAAQQVLVDNGSRSFRFMQDTVAAIANQGSRDQAGVDQSIWVHRIRSALEMIESDGRTKAPSSLCLSLALALCRSGDYQASSKYFDRAGDTVGDDSSSLFYRGRAYSKTKRYQDAMRNYQRYLDTNPTAYARAITLSNMGSVAKDSGDDTQAERYYRDAMRTDPRVPNSYNNLAWLFAERRRNLDEALRLVTRALELQPGTPEYLDTKGWIFYQQGKKHEALALLQQAVKASPYDAEIKQHLAAATGDTRQERAKR